MSEQQEVLFSTFKESIGKGDKMVPCFKFVRSLSDEDAQKFLLGLMSRLTIAFDTGDIQPTLEYAYEWQLKAYDDPKQRWSYDDGPLTRLSKPLAESRVALFSSSGHFVEGHDPKPFGIDHMSQSEATGRIMDFVRSAPQLSEIPADTLNDQLCVRHGGYDVAGAAADPNVTFPLERLREFVSEGVIGELAPLAYSFVGACAQTRLLRHQGPEWVEMIKAQEIDAMILVPA